MPCRVFVPDYRILITPILFSPNSQLLILSQLIFKGVRPRGDNDWELKSCCYRKTFVQLNVEKSSSYVILHANFGLFNLLQQIPQSLDLKLQHCCISYNCLSSKQRPLNLERAQVQCSVFLNLHPFTSFFIKNRKLILQWNKGPNL